MAAMGQLRPRRQPRLNDRSRFSEEAFAGAHANGREAPDAVIRSEATVPPSRDPERTLIPASRLCLDRVVRWWRTGHMNNIARVGAARDSIT